MTLVSKSQRHASDLSSEGQLSLAAQEFLADHTIGGRILLPGVAYVEMSMVRDPAH